MKSARCSSWVPRSRCRLSLLPFCRPSAPSQTSAGLPALWKMTPAEPEVLQPGPRVFHWYAGMLGVRLCVGTAVERESCSRSCCRGHGICVVGTGGASCVFLSTVRVSSHGSLVLTPAAHLGRLVDGMHLHAPVLCAGAIQPAPPLDGESVHLHDVGLEGVGCVPVKGQRGAVGGLLPAGSLGSAGPGARGLSCKGDVHVGGPCCAWPVMCLDSAAQHTQRRMYRQGLW